LGAARAERKSRRKPQLRRRSRAVICEEESPRGAGILCDFFHSRKSKLLANASKRAKDCPSVKLIDRYVGWQVLLTSTIAVAVLSVVLVLGNIFKQLMDVLVKSDTPMALILSVLSYILPFSLMYTIPWGFLTAVLLVFGKMSAENELIALRACGVSIPRICLPLLALTAVCIGVCFWINVDVAPRAQAKMKDAIFNIATSNPLAMFGSDKIIEDFPGKKIYVERNEGAQLYNLLVYEMNEDFMPMKVVFAERGLLETDKKDKKLLMHLFDARYEQRDDQEAGNLMKVRQGITAQENTLEISLEDLSQSKRGKGIGSMTANELLDRWRKDDFAKMSEKDRREQISASKTELSRRVAFSLASFAFALIGVPLAITAHRKETSVGLIFSLALGVLYFFLIIAINHFRENDRVHPELLMWIPNVLCMGLGGWLFYRMSRR
jgi:lipopolysaccharide export LptBFGC system permease protein LptF